MKVVNLHLQQPQKKKTTCRFNKNIIFGPRILLANSKFFIVSTTSLQWIILVLLLTASALISGAEVAFFSLTPTLLEQAKREEQKNISRIENAPAAKRLLATTILVANNFINIAIVLLFASLSSSFFSHHRNLIFNYLLKLLLSHLLSCCLEKSFQKFTQIKIT